METEDISFSQFVKLTAPVLKGRMSQPEYARTLLMLACKFPDMNDNPVSRRSEEVFKLYYTGSRGIGGVASEISRYVDNQILEQYLDNLKLSYDAEMALFKALSPYSPAMTEASLYQEISKMLEKIILKASARRRGTVAAEPFSAGDGEIKLALVHESNGKCAFCLRKLITSRTGEVQLNAVVTRITPSSLDSGERIAYKRAGISLPEAGTVDDYIALCPNCSADYQNAPSFDRVKKAIEIKDGLKTRQAAQERLDAVSVESDIEMVLEALCRIQARGEVGDLRMDALDLRSKVSNGEPLLKDRISCDVARYYRFVEDAFRRISDKSGTSFDSLIALQVKLAFESIRGIGKTQSETYRLLVEWLQEKTHATALGACEIIISFFVQNCEVFDELSKQSDPL